LRAYNNREKRANGSLGGFSHSFLEASQVLHCSDILIDQLIEEITLDAMEEERASLFVELENLPEDENIYECDDALIQCNDDYSCVVENIKKPWNESGHCCNVRNFGNSERSYFRKKRKYSLLADTAIKNSQNIQNCFMAASINTSSVRYDNETNGNDQIGYETETEIIIYRQRARMQIAGKAAKAREKLDKKFLIATAITQLSQNEAIITKNQQKNEMNKISKWHYLVALSIQRYLELLQNNMGKTEASEFVAYSFYASDSNVHSYKSVCIRQWADIYLAYGELPEYKQGKFAKTSSIIIDEDIQMQLKLFLRSLKNEDRTPANFSNALNSSLLREIPTAPDCVSVETARRWLHLLKFTPSKEKKAIIPMNTTEMTLLHTEKLFFFQKCKKSSHF
jgi:hypothetical protein